MMKFFRLLLFLFSSLSFAQENIDSEILQNLSESEVKNLIDEIQLDDSQSSTQIDLTDSLVEENQELSEESQDLENENNLKKFGYDFFSKIPTTVTPTADLPVPNKYIVSLNDQFEILLSGGVDRQLTLNVNLDGTILFPEVGSIQVVGDTFDVVKNRIKQRVQSSYVGVSANISLSSLSAKKINVVGAVSTPGTYLVNPFTSITSALAYAGGIMDYGSLRSIKVIKPNNDVYIFDLYDLLIFGNRSNDILLDAGDTVLVEGTDNFIEIFGEVIRPAIYEYKNEEIINELISLALGVKKQANKNAIGVLYWEKESLSYKTKVQNIADKFKSENTLSVEVFEIGASDVKDIQVRGPITNPGYFSYVKYKNLENIVNNLTFTNDVYPFVASLQQYNPINFKKDLILFSLSDPSTYKNIEVYPGAEINFLDIDEFKILSDLGENEENIVNIKLAEKIGKDIANKIAEYALRINFKSEQILFPVFGKFTIQAVINFLGINLEKEGLQNVSYTSPSDDLTEYGDYNSMSFQAEKYHTLTIPERNDELVGVSIGGEVFFPGTYRVGPKTTLSELVIIAGGMRSSANDGGLILKRETVKKAQADALESAKSDLNEYVLNQIRNGNEVSQQLISLLQTEVSEDNLGRIGGNFTKNSKNYNEFTLEDGDSILIPQQRATVTVLGEVLNSNTVAYSDNFTLADYIDFAGGLKNTAKKTEIYIIRENGLIEKGNINLFLGSSYSIMPGDTIVIPRNLSSINDFLPIVASITSVISNVGFLAASLNAIQN